MKLLIALVNYKTTDLLIKCLDSLRDQEIQTDYRIVVVDNHSQDGAVEQLRRKYPDITVITNTSNSGYARAVNQAIREVDSEYILLLNPDIEVKPGAIDAMVKFMEDTQDVGIVGGKLFNPDGTLQYSCRTFYTLPAILLRRTFLGKLFSKSKILTRHLMSDWDHNSVRDVDWVLGACMMIRRSALKDVGLMDERFFLYFEDVDWCYRMKKRGWRVCYLPDAEMVHHHRRQSAQGLINKTLILHILSMVHFYDKWGSVLYMLRKYRMFLGIVLFLLADLAAINLSFYGAYLIRKNLLLFLKKPPIPFIYYHSFLVFVNVVMPLVLYSLGLYTTRRWELWVDELFRIGKGVLISSLLLMAGSYLVQGYEFSRSMIVVFAVLCILVMFTFRWSGISWYNSLRRKGFNLRRTLIVGIGKTAAIVKKELQKHREIGFDLVGFVRDRGEPDGQGDKELFPILGTVEQLPTLVHDHHINELIIASAVDSRELISRCKQNGMSIHLVTDLYSLSMHETEFEELAGIPMVFFKGNPLFGFNLVIKRCMDLVLSSLGLALLSPILAIIAILIKLESPGSVIFKQERIGRGHKPFTMFKFRSMCAQADTMKEGLQPLNEASGPLFKIQNDPRLTRVGKFIRKYSLDELPQLVNVLKGDMSLVGPRPPVQREVDQYSELGYKRLDIKPGITGLWQVSGRSDLSFDEMLKLDIYYIWNWSLSNDLKILLRTVPMVLTGKGAY
jgi:exopolysaccharide biosynthesis polyprenyl glycosylphosphotransferase